MFALGIRYLTGFVAASEPDNRDRPEWPPHPARVFMALAAAHFETGGAPEERLALEWLEALPPPALRAPEITPRRVVTHYVPVNDKAGEKTKPPTAVIQSAPQLARDRQPRTFARAWIDGDTVYLAWRDIDAEPPVLRALDALARNVTRIGHSMSLIQMWVATPEEVNDLNWVPDAHGAELALRVVAPGTLQDLEARYHSTAIETYAALVMAAQGDSDRSSRREAKKRLKEEFGDEPPLRLRPRVSHFQGYARVRADTESPVPPGSVFSPYPIVFALEPRSSPLTVLGLPATLQVVQRWREALVSRSNDMPDAVRAVVSGHERDGAPLNRPHVALLPLAFVGHPHADGHLVGLAAALPSALAADERRQVLRVLARVGEIKLGALGVWALVRDLGARPAWTLHPEAWTAHPEGATHWSTVTPVAFDRHPKARDRAESQREAAEMIARACGAASLPPPREVIVTPVSAHLGVPPAHVFPRVVRKDGSERRHTHAILVFEGPVRGPVLIGAGRYRGYGVCKPLEAALQR